MKKSTKIILTISVCMILIGTAISGFAYVLAGGRIGVVYRNGKVYPDESGWSTYNAGPLVEKEYTTEVPTDLKIDVDLCNVELLTQTDGSNQVKLEYAYPENDPAPEIRVEGQKLTFVNELPDWADDGDGRFLFFNLFDWSREHRSVNREEGYLRIYLPEGVALGKVDISADLGEMKLHFPKDVTMEELELSSGLGEIRFSGAAVTGKIDVESELGEIVGKEFSSTGLSVGASMGSIDLSGSVEGDIELEASMGDVRLKLDQPMEAFGINTSVSMGSVTINGVDQDHDFLYNQGGGYRLEVDSSMGSVSLDFQ